jgi:serine phosphatase RsbU (regulator of sigma subunit)
MGDVLPALDRFALATAQLSGPGDRRGAGGAWFEVAAGDDGSVAVALGEVQDAGVAERLCRAVAATDAAERSPAATVDRLDLALRGTPAPVEASVLCLTLDPAGTLRWAAAGHAPPLVVGPDGARRLEGTQGAPIGHAGRPAGVVRAGRA